MNIDVRNGLGQAALCGLLACLLGSGCSIKHYALNRAADALSGTGGAFASDDDPDLIKAAIPFSLKLMESILSETPNHKGLLTAASSGFMEYSYAFVQQEADELESRDLAASEAMRSRARRLYLRAKGYGLRGLEVAHPGFTTNLLRNPKQAVRVAKMSDVPLLYWTAASWASAISLSKDNPELIGEMPAMTALIDRAMDLDEGFQEGALHTFMITFEMSRPATGGDPEARARKHFERSVALSHGQDASPFIGLAESVTIKKQNAQEFESLLNQALAINPDARPDNRVLNMVMQRRARWLLSRKSDLFLTE
jgi:predicted anti-sigma-YlaC factor YlaD